MMKLATVLVLLVGLAVSGGDYAATSNIRGDLTFPVERELSHRKSSSSSSSKSGSCSGSRSGGRRRCGYVLLETKGSDSKSCYRKLKKEIEEKLRVHVTGGSSSSHKSSQSRGSSHSHHGGWRNLRPGRKLNGSPSSSSSSSHKHSHSHSGSRSKSWTCYGRKVDEITIHSSHCNTSDRKEIIDDIEEELYDTYRDSRADYCARKGSSSSSSSESSSSSSSKTKSSSSSSESSSSSSDTKASSSSGSKASKSTERK